jgi:hypothetical protein
VRSKVIVVVSASQFDLKQLHCAMLLLLCVFCSVYMHDVCETILLAIGVTYSTLYVHYDTTVYHMIFKLVVACMYVHTSVVHSI